jgi:hypothetical protein
VLALMAILFVKGLKHGLCRAVSRMLVNYNTTIPPETTMDKVVYVTQAVRSVASNIAPAMIIESIGVTVQNMFYMHSRSVCMMVSAAATNIAVFLGFATTATAGMVLPATAPIIATSFGIAAMCEMAMMMTGEALKMGAEFAAHQKLVRNVFTELFELIQIKDCMQIYHDTVALTTPFEPHLVLPGQHRTPIVVQTSATKPCNNNGPSRKLITKKSPRKRVNHTYIKRRVSTQLKKRPRKR